MLVGIDAVNVMAAYQPCCAGVRRTTRLHNRLICISWYNKKCFWDYWCTVQIWRLLHTHLSFLTRSLDTPTFLHSQPCPFVPLSSGSFLFSFLSITYLGLGTFMGRPIYNRVVLPAVFATCFTACPKSATRFAHDRHCLTVSNVVPGFVLTLLITFPKQRLK